MGERLDVEESGFIGSITLRSSGFFGLFFLISNLIQLSFYFFQIPSSRMYLWTVTVAYVLGSTVQIEIEIAIFHAVCRSFKYKFKAQGLFNI
jgi:hypothetical protein